MRFHYSRVHRFYLAPAVGLVCALAITACSSSGSSSSSTATSAPAATTSAATASATASAAAGGSATAQITANWEAFFNPATPNSKRVQLLENGAEFASAINAFSASPLAQSVSSKVDSVSVTSSTKANVKYDLSAAGTSVASGQTGTAVLQDGTWKVGDEVFCGLLKQGASLLNIKIPAACNSAS
jgi:outer membrane protein TolC